MVHYFSSGQKSKKWTHLLGAKILASTPGRRRGFQIVQAPRKPTLKRYLAKTPPTADRLRGQKRDQCHHLARSFTYPKHAGGGGED
ncbi:hypothetical protein J6590_054014 [Homalodisca vitripennis]|nr:hypothetical protein J6590_054014 [Homalodisca vitripennis]